MDRTISDQEHLKAVIQHVRATSFTTDYQAKASDAECLGLAIAHFFEWDGLQILETAVQALDDANFHTEAGVISAMIEKETQAP